MTSPEAYHQYLLAWEHWRRGDEAIRERTISLSGSTVQPLFRMAEGGSSCEPVAPPKLRSSRGVALQRCWASLVPPTVAPVEYTCRPVGSSLPSPAPRSASAPVVPPTPTGSSSPLSPSHTAYQSLHRLHRQMRATLKLFAGYNTPAEGSRENSEPSAGVFPAQASSSFTAASSFGAHHAEEVAKTASLLRSLQEGVVEHEKHWGVACSCAASSPLSPQSAFPSVLAVHRSRTRYTKALRAGCERVIKRSVSKILKKAQEATRRCLSQVLEGSVLHSLSRLSSYASLVSCEGVLKHIREGTAAPLSALRLDREDRAWLERIRSEREPSTSPPELYLGGLQLTYSQLLTLLRPRSWLSDQVVNAYVDLVCRSSLDGTRGSEKPTTAPCASLGTHFFTKAMVALDAETNHPASTAAGAFPSLSPNSSLLRWLRRRTTLLRPPALTPEQENSEGYSSVYLVLIPINLDNQHWVLVVWDRLEREFTLYDSLLSGPATQEAHLHRLAKLRHVLSECYRLLTPETSATVTFNPQPWVIAQHTLRIAEPPSLNSSSSSSSFTKGHHRAPQQLNGSDCGVFVCLAAWCRTQGVCVQFPTAAEDITFLRTIMAMELWCNKLWVRMVSCFHRDERVLQSQGGDVESKASISESGKGSLTVLMSGSRDTVASQ